MAQMWDFKVEAVTFSSIAPTTLDLGSMLAWQYPNSYISAGKSIAHFIGQ